MTNILKFVPAAVFILSVSLYSCQPEPEEDPAVSPGEIDTEDRITKIISYDLNAAVGRDTLEVSVIEFDISGRVKKISNQSYMDVDPTDTLAYTTYVYRESDTLPVRIYYHEPDSDGSGMNYYDTIFLEYEDGWVILDFTRSKFDDGGSSSADVSVGVYKWKLLGNGDYLLIQSGSNVAGGAWTDGSRGHAEWVNGNLISQADTGIDNTGAQNTAKILFAYNDKPHIFDKIALHYFAKKAASDFRTRQARNPVSVYYGLNGTFPYEETYTYVYDPQGRIKFMTAVNERIKTEFFYTNP